MSPEEHWRKLNAIAHFVRHTEMETGKDERKMEVFLRWAELKAKSFANLSIRLPTPEDLIILKAITYRPKDLEDIRTIAEKFPDLDINRIEEWVRSFGDALEYPEVSDRHIVSDFEHSSQWRLCLQPG